MSVRHRKGSRRNVHQVLGQAVGGLVAMDPLESRRLLTATLDTGLLSVVGTGANDDISVAVSGGNLNVTVNGQNQGTFALTDVNGIEVSGLNGNDSISLAGINVPATLSGGDGNDTLVGGAANDFLSGNDGNDTFFSNDGQPDALDGGDGNDTASAIDSVDTFANIEAGIPVAHVAVTLGGNPVANNASVDFGSVNQGDTGPTRTFTVTNSGTDTLILGNITLPQGFVLLDPLVGPLAPGASESFTIGVDTSATGVKTGVASFGNSDPDQNPFSFNVTATVNPAPPKLPDITVELDGANVVDGQTTPLSFGSPKQGTTAPTLTFVLSNTGESVLNLGTITLPAGYTLVEGLVASLAPGESDTFTVRLDTAVVGTKAGEITIASNDPDEDPFNFAITGAVAPVIPETEPAITVTLRAPAGPIDNGNSSVEFGNREAGNKGPTRTFRIFNTGLGDLVIGQITLPAGFTLAADFSGTLAPGAGTSITIQLDTGGAPGTRTGLVTIPTNVSGASAFTFRVTGAIVGVGTGPIPEITVNASQGGQLRGVVAGSSAFAFGTAAQGSKISRAARTFRVANDGNANLQLGAITVPSGFAVLGGIPSVLKPGESANLVIALNTAGTTGAKSGQVRFTTNDSNETPFTFNVSGTVGAPGAGGTPEVAVALTNGTPVADGATAAVSFGTVARGAAAPTRTFRVTNSGTGVLNVGSVSVPGGFAVVEQLSGPIMPGATTSFTVRMDTGSAGNKSGQISFTSNDSNESPFNFAIAGTVTAPVVSTPQVTASISGTILTISGTSGIDTISIGRTPGGKVAVVGNGKAVGGSPFSGVARIVVNGNDGDDRLDAAAISIPVTLNGGNGNDTLIGGAANDLLSGGNGNDNLDGGAGDDTLLGGANDDVLTGGVGVDSLKGEDGNDTLNGADGLADLFLDGGPGSDAVHKDRTDPWTNT
jgi:hypothetical protein